jgi:PII-like signaling protein
MDTTIKIQKIGKLRIYLKTGETVKSDKTIHRFFPKSKYRHILEEAKKAGIMNAHIYNTHAAYERGGKVHHTQFEGDNSGLTVCLELVDEREKLEAFFKTHRNMLRNKTVIYKEVELWEFDAQDYV